ncbi:MAG: gamma carbonic anhydrase family protein [Candidatus Delongbacteria bacterium]|nr:gamma carbonic anhydrase family protein [Candidatus Delongbacteria bacterium]MCG2760483.1 gamma carbonic anhydrase family protein [Candidatus Delongbacteria bacterium]
MILGFKGIKPEIDESVFVAPSAHIIGRVKIGRNSSVWFNATIRADMDDVIIGEYSNIQDNCCLHQTEGYPLIIGNNVIVGHSVTLHGCKIGDNTLIGMGATILDDAKIGKCSIVAAGSVVLEHKSFPDYSLIAGIPAKVIKELPKDTEDKLYHHALSYADFSITYKDEIK